MTLQKRYFSDKEARRCFNMCCSITKRPKLSEVVLMLISAKITNIHVWKPELKLTGSQSIKRDTRLIGEPQIIRDGGLRHDLSLGRKDIYAKELLKSDVELVAEEPEDCFQMFGPFSQLGLALVLLFSDHRFLMGFTRQHIQTENIQSSGVDICDVSGAKGDLAWLDEDAEKKLVTLLSHLRRKFSEDEDQRYMWISSMCLMASLNVFEQPVAETSFLMTGLQHVQPPEAKRFLSAYNFIDSVLPQNNDRAWSARAEEFNAKYNCCFSSDEIMLVVKWRDQLVHFDPSSAPQKVAKLREKMDLEDDSDFLRFRTMRVPSLVRSMCRVIFEA